MQRMMQICTAVFREQNPWDRIMKGIARRVSSGGMSIGIVPIFLVMLVFYGIMWKFMKKTGRIILAIFLVICLVVGIAVINELGSQDDMYSDGGYVGEEIVAEGYITEFEVPVYEGPSADSAQCGTYTWGDYVYIYEIVDGWGRTDWGWIQMDKVSDQLPEGGAQGGEQSGNQGGGNTQQGNSPTQNETVDNSNGATQLPSSDNNQAILGEWYWIGGPDDGGYTIDLVAFTSSGYYGTESWSVYPPNWDQRIPNGAFDYDYATQGNTLYLRAYRVSDDDVPTVSKTTFSVNGEVLKVGGSTYYRGGYDAALAKIKQEYGGAVSPGDNSAVVGTWYRYSGPMYINGSDDTWVCLTIWEFSSNGTAYQPSYDLYLSEKDSWEGNQSGNMMCSYPHTYRVEGSTITTYLEGDLSYPRTANFSISGNVMNWDGSTYYRGGYADAVAQIKAELG